MPTTHANQHHNTPRRPPPTRSTNRPTWVRRVVEGGRGGGGGRRIGQKDEISHDRVYDHQKHVHICPRCRRWWWHCYEMCGRGGVRSFYECRAHFRFPQLPRVASLTSRLERTACRTNSASAASPSTPSPAGSPESTTPSIAMVPGLRPEWVRSTCRERV